MAKHDTSHHACFDNVAACQLLERFWRERETDNDVTFTELADVMEQMPFLD